MYKIFIDLISILNRKDDFMVAMLWAQQIILEKKEYKDVPRLLKDKVKEILLDSGMGELVNQNE